MSTADRDATLERMKLLLDVWQDDEADIVEQQEAQDALLEGLADVLALASSSPPNQCLYCMDHGGDLIPVHRECLDAVMGLTQDLRHALREAGDLLYGTWDDDDERSRAMQEAEAIIRAVLARADEA